MNRIKNIIIILILALIFFGKTTVTVFANEHASSEIVVSPMNQKVILMPGDTYRGSILVSNPNSAINPLDYDISIGTFNQTSIDGGIDDYGEISTTNKTDYNQIVDWIKLEKDNGTLLPNTTDTIPFSIKVPEDAPAGGQYATLLVRNVSDGEKIESGIIEISGEVQIASIIYAEVAGETIEEGKVIENNISSFLMNNSLETTSRVRNNGNVHTDAEYTLQVWPLFSDEEICTNEENPEKSLVLPETERYHAQTCQLPTVGIFRAKQVVKIFGETSIVEKTIIVCPIWLLFIIIFAIIMLISYFVVKAKNRKKTAKKS